MIVKDYSFSKGSPKTILEGQTVTSITVICVMLCNMSKRSFINYMSTTIQNIID